MPRGDRVWIAPKETGAKRVRGADARKREDRERVERSLGAAVDMMIKRGGGGRTRDAGHTPI